MNRKINWTVTTVNKHGVVVDTEYFCTRDGARIYKNACKEWDAIAGYKRFIDRYTPESVR